MTGSMFDFSGPGGLALIAVIFNLAYASPEVIGIDPTMIVDQKTGQLSAILVNPEPLSPTSSPPRLFSIVRLLHFTNNMTGRATRVWLTKEKGQFYVLKDSWILAAQPFSEINTIVDINTLITRDPEVSRVLRHCTVRPVGHDIQPPNITTLYRINHQQENEI